MKRFIKFLGGAVIGAFVGSAIVILLTPESGEETRIALSARIKNLSEQLKQAYSDRKTELLKEIEEYKDSAV